MRFIILAQRYTNRKHDSRVTDLKTGKTVTRP